MKNLILTSTINKSILFLILFLKSSFSFSQMTSNTKEGIDTRWISIEPNSNNTILFQSSSKNDTLIYLIDFIEKLTKEGAPIYYIEKNDIKDKTKYYVDIEPFPNDDSVRRFYPDDQIVSNELSKINNFIIGLSYYNTLKNYDGYEIIVMEGGGEEIVLIAPLIYSFIQKNEVTNIRIREELVYNSDSKSFDFKPVGLYLSPQIGNNSNYEIWIDINRLTSNIENPESYVWFNFIKEMKYTGFQYMQSEKNENQYFPSKIEEYSYDEIIDDKSNLKIEVTKKTLLDAAVEHTKEIDNNKFVTNVYRDFTFEIKVFEGNKTKFKKTFKTSDFLNKENNELEGKLISTFVSFVEYNKQRKRITLEFNLVNPVTGQSFQYFLFINKDGSYSILPKKE